MLFITPAKPKRNPIYDKSYQNMLKIYKIQNEQTSTKIEIFKSNGSFSNFYPNFKFLLSLYTRWAKLKPVSESSTLYMPEMKIASEIDHFVFYPN